MSKQHFHAINVEEDLIFDYNWNSAGHGNQNIKEFPSAIERLLKVEVDGRTGYKFPIGFIRRMPTPEAAALYSLSDVKTAVSSDMYKHIKSVIDMLELFDFNVSFSDVLRFMIWINFPHSIAPNGDLMTGEYGWLPSVVWMFDFFDDDIVRFDKKESHYCTSVGMKHCDRKYSNSLIRGISEANIKNVFINGGWKPEILHESLILPKGEEFYYIAIQVLKEVEGGEKVDGVTKSN